MAPIRYSGNYATNWTCGVCETAHTNRDGFTPWDTSDGSIVCEGCITRKFDEALHGFDVKWPARWKNDELDPRNFASFLSAHYINKYLTKRSEIAQRRSIYHPEPLDDLKRGEDYQVCPRCKTFGFLDSDCMDVRCECLASFCFRCGKEVEDIDPLDMAGHWNEQDGCKRLVSPISGEQQGGESGSDGSEEEFIQMTPAKLERLDAAASRFNAAMQGAGAQNQSRLRRYLEATSSLSQVEMTKIWNMMSARPGHGSEDEWTDGERLREQCLMEFLSHVKASEGQEKVTQHEYFHVVEGAYLLLKPIGGIFDMSGLKTRLAACAWLDDRITSVVATDRYDSAAIFVHHDGPDRIIAFDLLYRTLKCYLFVLPYHVVSFDFLGNVADNRHLGIFVQVQERSNPKVDEFCDRTVGDFNALCGLIVNPEVNTFATPDRPVGMYLGSGHGGV